MVGDLSYISNYNEVFGKQVALNKYLLDEMDLIQLNYILYNVW